MDDTSVTIKSEIRGLTDKQSQIPRFPPIEVSSDDCTDSGSSSNTSGSSLEKVIEFVRRKFRGKRKRRKKRSLKDIDEYGPVTKKLKAVPPDVLIPVGFLRPISSILRGSVVELEQLNDENVASSRHHSLSLVGEDKQYRARQASGNCADSSSCEVRRHSPSTSSPMKDALPSEETKSSAQSYGHHSCQICPSRENSQQEDASNRSSIDQLGTFSHLKEQDNGINGDAHGCAFGEDGVNHVKDDNIDSAERIVQELGFDVSALLKSINLEKDKGDLLEKKLKEAEQQRDALTNMLSEEKRKAAEEEDKLREKLTDASDTIDMLLEKLTRLQGVKNSRRITSA